ALKIASFFPQTSDPCGRIIWGARTIEDQHQYVGKIDYHLNAKQSVFGRYLATKINTTAPYSIQKNILTTNVYGQDDLATSAALGHTYLLSVNTVNSFRVSMNRIAGNHPGASFFGPDDVGVNAYSYLPHYMNIAITGGPSIGAGTSADLHIFV